MAPAPVSAFSSSSSSSCSSSSSSSSSSTPSLRSPSARIRRSARAKTSPRRFIHEQQDVQASSSNPTTPTSSPLPASTSSSPGRLVLRLPRRLFTASTAEASTTLNSNPTPNPENQAITRASSGTSSITRARPTRPQPQAPKITPPKDIPRPLNAQTWPIYAQMRKQDPVRINSNPRMTMSFRYDDADAQERAFLLDFGALLLLPPSSSPPSSSLPPPLTLPPPLLSSFPSSVEPGEPLAADEDEAEDDDECAAIQARFLARVARDRASKTPEPRD